MSAFSAAGVRGGRLNIVGRVDFGGAVSRLAFADKIFHALAELVIIAASAHQIGGALFRGRQLNGRVENGFFAFGLVIHRTACRTIYQIPRKGAKN